MSKRYMCLLGTVAAMLLSVPFLQAQTTFGSITGNVTDSSGAAVANTEVVLTNLGTNERRTVTTNADGLYNFVNLVPASYSVSIEKAGFKRVVRSPVTVQTETTSKIDLTLDVGAV